MKRAWMPVGVALTGLVWLAGCDPAAVSWWNKNGRDRAAPPSAVGEMANGQRPGAQTRPADESTALMRQIQSYVAQFPADDRDREQAWGHPAVRPSSSPPPAPGFARAPGNQPTIIYRSPESPAGGVTPGTDSPPVTSAMAPAQLRPTRAGTEAAASPVVPDLHAALPVPAGAPKVELLQVRAVQPAVPSSQPSPAANQPIAPGAPAPVTGIDALIAQLQGTIKLHPQQIEDQFRLRLLYAAAGQDDRAAGPIEGVDPVQGELIAAVLRAVIGARKAMQDPVAASAQAISAAEELRRLIGQQSPVMIPRLALVTRVNSFGDYDAVDPAKFAAGQPVHVFLYTEVKNFRSEATPDNRLRTVLGEKVEIYDATGKIVWQRAEPTIEDRSHSPRSDFFMTMEIELPGETPVGDYVLKVTVDDKLGATTDQQRLGFTIAAK